MKFLRDIFHQERRIIILDDIFPYLLSGFRIAEYNWYLREFDNIEIYSFAKEFEKYRDEYVSVYPEFSGNVHRGDSKMKYKGSLLYAIFLNNIFEYLPIIERQRIPFVFTLYPGGGFRIGDADSNNKLKTVCQSEYLRKVIVTQCNTRDYLLENDFCPQDKIEFIYGGVLPSDYFKKNKISKKYYQKDKETFDVCFVANKYMDKGLDKGYDVFVEVAKILVKKFQDIRFHVVGAFNEHDISITEMQDKITFYGLRYKDFFGEFYSGMDIILSPNRPYTLLPGSFDGFPTGSCIEAGFAGVAVFCSDQLSLNICLKDREDIQLITTDASDIAKIISRYHADPKILYRLASNGQRRFYEIFSLEEQVGRRSKILNEYMC